jgi:tRNA-dependent cyclodipeptide synthase
MNDVTYSVRVKNGAGWRRFSRVRLMISVGQPYHEGSKLQAVVDWINRNAAIAEVHVSVNDLLQRHNLEVEGMDAARAAVVSEAQGALWLARNDDVLAGIKTKVVTTRWSSWLERQDFQAARNALHELATRDAAFADALDVDSAALVERRLKRGEPIDDAAGRLKTRSRDYIIEELAVFALQCREMPGAEVYPGSNLQSAEYLRGKRLPDILSALSGRHFTRIDFARLSAPSATTVASRPKVG